MITTFVTVSYFKIVLIRVLVLVNVFIPLPCKFIAERNVFSSRITKIEDYIDIKTVLQRRMLYPQFNYYYCINYCKMNNFSSSTKLYRLNSICNIHSIPNILLIFPNKQISEISKFDNSVEE